MGVLRRSFALLLAVTVVLAGCGGESGVELPASLADQMNNERAPALVYVYSDP
jgi:predicted small lipoprotein YifL